jgi:hypothetical protein
MKKIALLLILLFLFSTVGCSSDLTADKTPVVTEKPDEIAVRFATAKLQANYRREMALATPSLQKEIVATQNAFFQDTPYESYGVQTGPESKKQLAEDYQLEAYKPNDTTYYYHFIKIYQFEGEWQGDYLKVVKYKGEWKVDVGFPENEITGNEAKIKKTIVKKAADKPIFQQELAADYKQDTKQGAIARAKEYELFPSSGEVLSGYSPADIACQYAVLRTYSDFARLKMITTPAEIKKMENAGVNKKVPVSTYTTEDEGHYVHEIKKDNTTFYYKSILIDEVIEVQKINGQWKAETMDSSSEWDKQNDKHKDVKAKFTYPTE